MLEKFYAWHSANREEIDVASVLIVLCTIIYCIVFAINWILVSFLSFTGLKWVVFAIVGFATGTVAFAIYEGRDVWKKMEAADKSDEPGFL